MLRLLRGLLCRWGCLFGVLAAEALYAAGGVHKALLAGEERVAVGANFERDLALVGRARFKGVAARAVDLCGLILGVNIGLRHDWMDLSYDSSSLSWIRSGGNWIQAEVLRERPLQPGIHICRERADSVFRRLR